jgi:hypothetical protein
MTNLYTDNLELYHSLNLQNTKHALFTNESIVLGIHRSPVWTEADKIFVMGSEGIGHGLLTDTQRPNLYVWDSVLDSKIQNYKLFLDHWDRINIVDQELKLTDKLTNPLQYNPAYKFDALLGYQRPHREFIVNKISTSNFTDQFILSYYKLNRWIPGTNETDTDTLDKLEKQGHNFFERGGQNYNNELTTPSGFPYILSQAIPWNIFNDSWYSIITETYPTSKFVTEKKK